jgi:Protein of unknown function (DUF4238)
MNGPRDQHFIPQFLLRRWCNPEGKVTVYARQHERVVTSELKPRSTAFEPDLYSYEGVSGEQRGEIETSFMTPRIDTPAALIVQKIVAGGFTALTTEERSDFTRFVMSLRARHPDAVALALTEGERQLRAALARDPEEYQAVSGPDSPSTLTEWTEQYAPALFHNFGVSVVPGVITDAKVGERIFRMPWWVHDVRSAGIDLLISDRPCLLEGNAVEGQCLIALPLSPTMLFFICNGRRRTEALRAMNERQLVKTINRASAGYAAGRVYGTGPHHLPVVEKWLRR